MFRRVDTPWVVDWRQLVLRILLETTPILIRIESGFIVVGNIMYYRWSTDDDYWNLWNEE